MLAFLTPAASTMAMDRDSERLSVWPLSLIHIYGSRAGLTAFLEPFAEINHFRTCHDADRAGGLLQGFGNQVLALQTSRVYEAFGF